jgi:hypothetical protein
MIMQLEGENIGVAAHKPESNIVVVDGDDSWNMLEGERSDFVPKDWDSSENWEMCYKGKSTNIFIGSDPGTRRSCSSWSVFFFFFLSLSSLVYACNRLASSKKDNVVQLQSSNIYRLSV